MGRKERGEEGRAGKGKGRRRDNGRGRREGEEGFISRILLWETWQLYVKIHIMTHCTHSSATKNRDIAVKRLIHTRVTFSQSMIVSVDVGDTGRLRLMQPNIVT